jgi:hypothetical protein
MKLSGNCKKQFEKWFGCKTSEDFDGYNAWILDEFYNLPESMQFGVIQDFADSLGYDFLINWNPSIRRYFSVIRNKDTGDKMCHCVQSLTRQESRKAAIKKLNNLINEG